jgi:hypothetical protein
MPAGDWRYETPRNGWGTAALVCAVGALVIGFVPVLGDLVAFPVSVAAVGSGVVGLLRAEDGLATNPGTALAGILIGVVAGLLSFLTIISTVVG